MNRLHWGSRARPGLVHGLFFTTFFFVVLLDDEGRRIFAQLIGAIAGGLLVGIWTATDARRRWPAGRDLDAKERTAVVGLVAQGEGPQDARLAPAVIEFAEMELKATERSDREHWLAIPASVVSAGWACFEAARGHVGAAVFLWALTVFVAVGMARRSTVNARRRLNAERSEAAARAVLASQ
jgi:hypothetical protein